MKFFWLFCLTGSLFLISGCQNSASQPALQSELSLYPSRYDLKRYIRENRQLQVVYPTDTEHHEAYRKILGKLTSGSRYFKLTLIADTSLTDSAFRNIPSILVGTVKSNSRLQQIQNDVWVEFKKINSSFRERLMTMKISLFR